MALQECSECGNDVSDSASACPECGAPIESESTDYKKGCSCFLAFIVYLVVTAFFSIVCILSDRGIVESGEVTTYKLIAAIVIASVIAGIPAGAIVLFVSRLFTKAVE